MLFILSSTYLMTLWYGERKEMQKWLLTISVDFKLTNHQMSSIRKNKNIHVTGIWGDTFMACDFHWFPTFNGASWMSVEYFLFRKFFGRHIAGYAKPYRKIVKGNAVWKRYLWTNGFTVLYFIGFLSLSLRITLIHTSISRLFANVSDLGLWGIR